MTAIRVSINHLILINGLFNICNILSYKIKDFLLSLLRYPDEKNKVNFYLFL